MWPLRMVDCHLKLNGNSVPVQKCNFLHSCNEVKLFSCKNCKVVFLTATVLFASYTVHCKSFDRTLQIICGRKLLQYAEVNCYLLENFCCWTSVLYSQTLLHRLFYWKSFPIADRAAKTAKLSHHQYTVVHIYSCMHTSTQHVIQNILYSCYWLTLEELCNPSETTSEQLPSNLFPK